MFNIVTFSFDVRLLVYLLAFILECVHFVKRQIKPERDALGFDRLICSMLSIN